MFKKAFQKLLVREDKVQGKHNKGLKATPCDSFSLFLAKNT